MRYTPNVPFESVPREFIEQLNSCDYSYDDYRLFCPMYNGMPTYWNMAILNDAGEMVGFVWGILEPLERFLHVVRISILPSARKENSFVLGYVGDALRDAGRQMGASHIFFITDKPDIFIGKFPEKAKLSEGKLVEVKLNENLH